jgi:hypothetical protein
MAGSRAWSLLNPQPHVVLPIIPGCEVLTDLVQRRELSLLGTVVPASGWFGSVFVERVATVLVDYIQSSVSGLIF